MRECQGIYALGYSKILESSPREMLKTPDVSCTGNEPMSTVARQDVGMSRSSLLPRCDCTAASCPFLFTTFSKAVFTRAVRFPTGAALLIVRKDHFKICASTVHNVFL